MTPPAVSPLGTRVALTLLAATLLSLAGAQDPAFSEAELRDLRMAARTQAIRSAAAGAGSEVTAAEMRDLRAAGRTVPGPSRAPGEAFSEAELRDLRRLAQRESIAVEQRLAEAGR